MLEITQIAIQIGLTLALSILVGMEREQNIRLRAELPTLGGIRTFPLIGFLGYLLARSQWAFTGGILVLGALLAMQYRGKMKGERYGLTTEFSALVVYALGFFIFQGEYWLATTIAVITALLLQMKTPLESLALRISTSELITFSQFVMLSAVILPLVPNANYTVYQLNPFRTWLIVVAVSGVSYLSYILQQLRGEKQGFFLAGILGGIYSSTVTTVALSKQSRIAGLPSLTCAGAIIGATGMMYLRIIVLVWLFSPPLGIRLLRPFAIIALITLAISLGTLYTGRKHTVAAPFHKPSINPLQLLNAILFALVFIIITIVTRVVIQQFGEAGLFTLAGIMGPTDIDPFIMSMTQHAQISLYQSGLAIAVAVASNNIFKGGYAWYLAGEKVGKITLGTFALISLLTIILSIFLL
ncbi:MAG: MgtC/SapB family protein [Calditrichaeota bacterium]|nr:MAG: MgtC/SapB family protein [Calditrichota bacterium]